MQFQRGHSPLVRSTQQQEYVANLSHSITSEGEAQSEQEVGPGRTIPKPNPNDTLPPARIYFLETPQGSQAVSQAEDQVSNHMSHRGMFHIQITHKYIIIYISHINRDIALVSLLLTYFTEHSNYQATHAVGDDRT